MSLSYAFPNKETVVNAQRRTQRAQNVPISIAAYDTEELDRRGSRDIADVANFTAGLNFSEGNGRSSGINQIFIRGIASNGRAGTVGVYSASGNNPASSHIWDYRHVPLLRG